MSEHAITEKTSQNMARQQFQYCMFKYFSYSILHFYYWSLKKKNLKSYYYFSICEVHEDWSSV